MQIQLANIVQTPQVIAFFRKNIERHHSAIYSEEFVCPLGVQAAIRRKQMLIVLDDVQIVGALRFYPKKKANTISLYQFALNEMYRGQGILKKMLQTINDMPIIALCPSASEFNNYFYKSNWHLQEQNPDFTTWIFQEGIGQGSSLE